MVSVIRVVHTKFSAAAARDRSVGDYNTTTVPVLSKIASAPDAPCPLP